MHLFCSGGSRGHLSPVSPPQSPLALYVGLIEPYYFIKPLGTDTFSIHLMAACGGSSTTRVLSLTGTSC